LIAGGAVLLLLLLILAAAVALSRAPGAVGVAPGRIAAPSTDCLPASLAPNEHTACSVFLDSDVVRGTTIGETLTGPAGATITGCHSESGGLHCSETAGREPIVTCQLDVCRTGAQFTIDVTAPAAGELVETITIHAPGGAVSTFHYRGKATFH